MSLNFSLIRTQPTEIYTRNIAHNLDIMAREAGVYQALWHPEDPENNFKCARDLIEPLEKGLALLRSDPKRFKLFELGLPTVKPCRWVTLETANDFNVRCEFVATHEYQGRQMLIKRCINGEYIGVDEYGKVFLVSDINHYKPIANLPHANYKCTYEGLISFVEETLAACIEYPDAEFHTGRRKRVEFGLLHELGNHWKHLSISALTGRGKKCLNLKSCLKIMDF